MPRPENDLTQNGGGTPPPASETPLTPEQRVLALKEEFKTEGKIADAVKDAVIENITKREVAKNAITVEKGYYALLDEEKRVKNEEEKIKRERTEYSSAEDRTGTTRMTKDDVTKINKSKEFLKKLDSAWLKAVTEAKYEELEKILNEIADRKPERKKS